MGSKSFTIRSYFSTGKELISFTTSFFSFGTRYFGSKLLSTSEKDELNKKIDERNFNINIMNSQLKIVKDEKQYLTNELNNKNTKQLHNMCENNVGFKFNENVDRNVKHN